MHPGSRSVAWLAGMVEILVSVEFTTGFPKGETGDKSQAVSSKAPEQGNCQGRFLRGLGPRLRMKLMVIPVGRSLFLKFNCRKHCAQSLSDLLGVLQGTRASVF